MNSFLMRVERFSSALLNSNRNRPTAEQVHCQVPAAVGSGQVSPATVPLSDRRTNSCHGNGVFIFQGQRIPVFLFRQNVGKTFQAGRGEEAERLWSISLCGKANQEDHQLGWPSLICREKEKKCEQRYNDQENPYIKRFKSNFAPRRHTHTTHTNKIHTRSQKQPLQLKNPAKGKSSAPLNYWLNKLHVYSSKMSPCCFTFSLYIIHHRVPLLNADRSVFFFFKKNKKKTAWERADVFSPSLQQQKKPPVSTAPARKQPHGELWRQVRFQSCCWFAACLLTCSCSDSIYHAE